MDAGRELDARVAEKVMGLKVVTNVATFVGEDIESGWLASPDLGIWEEKPYWHNEYIYSPVPHYSTDIAAAWEVVERFDTCELKRWFQKHRTGLPEFYWTASLTKHDPEMYAEPVEAATAPLAICLAALQAIEAGEP